MAASDIGIAGLGAMGRNLGLQALERGHGVRAFDPWSRARAAWSEASGREAEDDPAAFAAGLARPKRILMLVKAGAPTEALAEALAPHLEPGDILADLGNSHFRATEAMESRLGERGIRYLGIGISGGAEGARRGASFMGGGDEEAWSLLAPLLESLAAEADGRRCRAWFGPGGAGHFVKMVHNGIEYAEMQALAECYLALRESGLEAPAVAELFDAWNAGIGSSFLTGLAASVLRTPDGEGGWLVDRVADRAGQKGTGRWTVETALELGVPAPTLAAAVFARGLSDARRGHGAADRQKARRIAPELLGDALAATRICAFAQGFALLGAGARARGWPLDRAEAARVWRAGSILRGGLLDPFAAALSEEPESEPIALRRIAELLDPLEPGWRRAVAACVEARLPAPALSSALAYRDGWRSARLGANLIAAQRDAFGGHGFRRADAEGIFRARWGGEER